MKAEVAKREIESLDYYLQNHTNDYGEESHTAMMMAISALSENKGDLISRKSLLNKINAYVVGSQDKEFICKLIKEMPSVENKGEWILDETDNSVECNKCGCQIYPNDISYGDAHFCPNCGCKMRGDTE